jgi:hypothetical protein
MTHHTIPAYEPTEATIGDWLRAVRDNLIDVTRRHHAEAGMVESSRLPALLQEQAS